MALDDIINALDGDDIVSAGGGNDLVNGGIGIDKLSGGVGDDLLHGDDGNDLLNSHLLNLCEARLMNRQTFRSTSQCGRPRANTIVIPSLRLTRRWKRGIYFNG